MNDLTEKKISYIRLNLVPGMTRERFIRLTHVFESPQGVFCASMSDFKEAGFRDGEFISRLTNPPDSKSLDKELSLIEKHGVGILIWDDEEYPVNLRFGKINPPILYVKGKIEKCDRFSITVVGTRTPTEYGKWAAKSYCRKLSEFGLTIISGMATGIDSVAHKTAIAAKGRTIAVLGNGLANCYPASNKRLMDEIACNGAVISEFPMETPPNAYNFPIRNEILASMGLATLVVEASEMSGSLITAKIAVDENKTVFAIPADINREASRGSNTLLRRGAIIALRPSDILEDLAPQIKPLLKECSEEEKIVFGAEKITAELAGTEKTIYEIVQKAPITIDDLFSGFDGKISMPELINTLFSLELKGVVEKQPGQIYTIKS